MMTARPSRAVANPTAVSTAISTAHNSMGSLLRSTALTLTSRRDEVHFVGVGRMAAALHTVVAAPHADEEGQAEVSA